jgi:serine phosphatase RsbU (regulator of sigma subunit)/PAS domain-containing protein
MPQDTWADGSAGLGGLAERRDALRQAAAMPGADPRALLEASFAELDAAVEALANLAEAAAGEAASAAPADSLSAERGLLRAVFGSAPVPLFVLEQDATVRRANARAGELIGAPPGYATGKSLTAFIDPPSRAAVKSQLAAAIRTGKARLVGCRLLSSDGPVDVTLAADVITLPDGTRLVVVAAASPEAAAAGPVPARRPARPPDGDADGLVGAMTRRMDMVTEVTRVLLDNSTFSEAVTLQRCARVLAGSMASWVIVDMERADVLRRQFVVGPAGPAGQELARKVRAVDPQPGSAPAEVHAATRSVLLAHADDAGILGADGDEVPLLMQIGATSVLSVPITDGSACFGALTFARTPGEGRFEIADLALAEELGQHLGVAIRVDRMFRHHTAVSETLQGSLLPASLPPVPGLDLSSAYQPATEGMEVSGDFYDVFQVTGGWAITVGDVCGKGQDAAAMTAAARHSIRTLAHWDADPAGVLAGVNEVILAGDYEDRFVTVKLAYLRWQDGRLHVRLASAGHPGPALVRSDGRVDVLHGGGLPLGLFPDADPQVEELDLGEDDLLFFYSDGLTDARSPDMRYFDDVLADQLASLAGRPAAETVRMMQGMVSSFAHDELRDDLTILVARVKAAPEAAGQN